MRVRRLGDCVTPIGRGPARERQASPGLPADAFNIGGGIDRRRARSRGGWRVRPRIDAGA
ncbi:hypothetical protein WI92_27460 [Burkholderia vietnamiensis]|nr:hypothetical protein WI92_27460 [Burkholderia vietnamiensis]CAG9199315.1 hypothetical protein BVI2075_270022 [Burkholderia vietnamiensis]